MKNLFAITFLLFASGVLACQNFIPLSQAVKAIANTSDSTPKDCKQLPEEDCLCFDGIVWKAANLKDEVVNGNPTYSSKENEQSCATPESCEVLGSSLCSGLSAGYQFFYAENLILPGYEAYCTKITGYEQVNSGKKVLYNDEVKLAEFNVEQSQKMALEQALKTAEKAQDCGRKTMAYMLVRNAPKSLTTAQVKQLVSTYDPIKGLLESGSLVTAQEEINAVAADGVLVTEADKTALVQFINGCKP